MMMPDLPPDLVEEILSRVPATSLKRLRSSCKRWNTLFKDRRFAEKHFHDAPRESHVIMLNEFMFCPMNVDLNVVPRSVEFKDEFRLIDFHTNKSEQVYISNCFHCDGLLLCTTTDRRLVVWNPCVGETRWIQYNNSYGLGSTFALGYTNTKSGRNYKLMRCWLVDYVTSNPVVETYEFRSDTWRVLDDVTLDKNVPYDCVSVNGNTYWVNYYFLLCFDFTKERVKFMCLPKLFKDCGWNVLSVVREEKLALLQQTHLMVSIWVTDKVGTDTEAALTWSKSFTLDIRNWDSVHKHFVLDEEKKMALICRDFNELTVYTIGEDERCYESIRYQVGSRIGQRWPLIFSYVPSLVQIHQ